MTESRTGSGFDRGAAVTRSMLGWGVVASPFYLIFGLILALTRLGFDLTRDALSLLLIGDLGWLQWLNLVLAGLMTIVAAIGLLRTREWSRAAGVLVGVYGVCLVLSAVFPPDATESFPPGAGGGDFTTQGILHLVFGGLGFVSVGLAAIIAAPWLSGRRPRGAVWSRVTRSGDHPGVRLRWRPLGISRRCGTHLDHRARDLGLAGRHLDRRLPLYPASRHRTSMTRGGHVWTQ